MDVAALQIKADSSEARRAKSDLDNLTASGEKAQRATSGLTSMFGKAMAAGAGFASGMFTINAAFDLATGVMSKYVENTIEAERVQSQLEARLRSTSGVAGMSMKSLNDLASSLQAMTSYDDEAIGSVEALLLTFTKIGKETFPDATKAVLNVSTALGTDLNSAAIQVGKALNDPIQGVTALGRAGVQFSDDQKKLIKSLVETGDVAGAQRIVLGELETQMGGAAEAARNTLGGAVDALKVAFDNLLEGDSGDAGVAGTRAAIESLISTLNSDSTHAAFQNVVNGIVSIVQEMAVAIPKIIEFNRVLSEGLGLRLQANGMQRGNVLDILPGAKANFSGHIDEIMGRLTGDKARAIGGRYKQMQGAERFRAGVLGREFDPDWSDTGPDGKPFKPHKPALNLPQYGNVPSFLLPGGQKFNPTDPRYNGNTPKGGNVTPITVPHTGGGKGGGGGGKSDEDRARERSQREFEALQRDLMTQEEKVKDSYERRRKIIEDNTKGNPKLHDELMAKLDADLRDEEKTIAASNERKLDEARQGLEDEEKLQQRAYEKQKQLIIDRIKDPAERAALLQKLEEQRTMEVAYKDMTDAEDRDRLLQTEESHRALLREQMEYRLAELQKARDEELITEEEFLKARKALYDGYAADMVKVETDKQQKVLAAGQQMFGGLANLAKAYGGEQSKTFRALFALQKAFTIAQAMLNIKASITEAMKLGWPQNIVPIAEAIGQGASILAEIKGINYAGAYDKGGFIPAGQWGIAGENGPEIINGPARVTSREQTARMLGGNGGPVVNIESHFHFDANGNVKKSGNESANDGDKYVMEQALNAKFRDMLVQEVMPGGIIWRYNNG